MYADQILPRFIDKVMSNDEIAKLRRRAVDGLSGQVVEIGFGSGLNVPVYPPEVTKVFAVDPAVVGRKLAATRLAASSVPVEFVGLDGEHLPLEDASVDNALSTFTLCTIPDAHRAVREVWRVLKSGGRFHFVEHGLSPDAGIVKWQGRIEPINRRVFGGCHLTRAHDNTLRDAGFVIERLDNEYGRGPKPFVYHYIGVARKQ